MAGETFAVLASPVTGPDALIQTLEAAVAHHQGGNLNEAERLYRHVLAQDPNQTDALNLLGVIAQQNGDLDQALAFFDRAMASAPELATIPFNKANALRDAGRRDEAQAAYEAALAINPRYADALLNLGVLLHDQGDAAAAIDRCTALLAIDPNAAQAHYNIGKCRQTQGRLNEAQAALDPAFADAYFAQANVLADLNKLEPAIEHIKQAVNLKPKWAEAYNNWGNYLCDLDRQQEALAKYDQAIALNNTNKNFEVNKGLALLALGELNEGWRLYKLRGETHAPYYRRLDTKIPPWQNEPLSGRTILINGEQGIGDEILYASMLHDFAANAKTVKVTCSKKLVGIFKRSFDSISNLEVLEDGGSEIDPAAFDFQTTFIDIGHALRSGLNDFPPSAPYLLADPARTREIEKRYQRFDNSCPPAIGRPLFVGISWSSTNPDIGSKKSIPLDYWEPILSCDGVQFFNLQTDEPVVEASSLKRQIERRLYSDIELNPKDELDDALAQLAAMDLVVTCSNTTAHLAGALGKKTWILIPGGRAGLWYWFKKSKVSPWYPQVTLYRKGALGEWPEVVDKVSSDLANYRDQVHGPKPAHHNLYEL